MFKSRKPDDVLDALLRLSFSSDELRASLSVGIEPERKKLSRRYIQGYLRRSGVVFGVRRDQIKALLQKIRLEEPIDNLEVACGTPPTRGAPGDLLLLVKTRTKNATSCDLRTLNSREQGQLFLVGKDEALLEVVPPGPGEPGHSVRGRAISPASGDSPPLPEQKTNIRCDPDGRTWRSSIRGQFHYAPDRMEVTTDLLIPGDVDIATENLKTEGEIRIGGSVRAGLVVESEKYISIGGDVEKGAEVRSLGSVEVGGKICCGKEVTLFAQESLSAQEILASQVEVKGNLTVDRLILDSFVVCYGRVSFRDPNGEIRGGWVEGIQGLTVPNAGSEGGVLTVLVAGATLAYEEKVKRLKRKVGENTRRIEEGVSNFRKRYAGVDTRKLERVELERFEDAKAAVTQTQEVDMKNLGEHKQLLRETRDKCVTCEDARVTIQKEGFPGTRICIGPRGNLTLYERTPPHEYFVKSGRFECRPLS